jgi:hypothetical protein
MSWILVWLVREPDTTEEQEQFLLTSVSRPDAILRLLLLFLLLAMNAVPYSRHWMREAKRHTRQFYVLRLLVPRMKTSLVMASSASPDAVMDTDALPEERVCIVPEMPQQMLLPLNTSSVPIERLTLDLSKIPYNPLDTKINDEKLSLH